MLRAPQVLCFVVDEAKRGRNRGRNYPSFTPHNKTARPLKEIQPMVHSTPPRFLQEKGTPLVLPAFETDTNRLKRVGREQHKTYGEQQCRPPKKNIKRHECAPSPDIPEGANAPSTCRTTCPRPARAFTSLAKPVEGLTALVCLLSATLRAVMTVGD